MATIAQLNLYLGMGRHLFPCSSENKKPLTSNGFKGASLNPDAIAKWHSQYPDCAWGTPTSSEYGVVDIDPRNGGDTTWASLIREHGPIPECPTVHTGGGGWHYVMRFPPGTRCGKIGVGIDLKADGGYVIVPPSRIYEPHHYQPYKWTGKLWEIGIPDAPPWLLGLASPKSQRDETVSPAQPDWEPGDIRTHPGSPEGERRVTLCRLVGTALGCGHSPEAVRIWAEDWASRCQPPFGEWEKHFAGLVRREKLNNTLHLSPLTDPVSPDTDKQTTNSPTPTPTGELVGCLREPGESARQLVGCLRGAGEEVSGEAEEVSGEDVVRHPPEPFALHSDAYHGPLGGVVDAIGPHTEADNPAVLLCLLAAFGNAVGFAPHTDHGKMHGANLFIGLVGATASRKGTATGIAKSVIADADPEWEHRVQHEGFGSGEGLIWSVRDPNPTDPVGITDKRLLVIEEEWAKTFTLSASDKSILTPIIRGCYDRIPVGKRNKGDNAYGCKKPHVSIIGNITPDDLRQSLTGKMAVSIANGFLNRFLLVATRRTKFLPRGGRWKAHAAPFLAPIRTAIVKAKTRTLMALDADAEAEWDALYAALENRPDGVPGAVTGRASDMVTKLAMVYALADGDVAIRVVHLRAGLAVWRYCEATAFALFGFGASVEASPEPDPLWVRILNAITNQPGVSRSALTVAFRKDGNADTIGDALTGLQAKGMAYPIPMQNPNGGPKGEQWYPGDGGEGERNNFIHLYSSTDPGSPAPLRELTNPFAGCRVEGGEGGEITGGITNSPPNPTGELVSSLNGGGGEVTESPAPDRELVSSLNGGAGEVSGERRKVIEVVRQWADKVNQWNADYEPRFEEHPSGKIQSRRMLPRSSGYGERVGELLRLPKPKPEPLSPITTDYILRHSDLRWDGLKVIGLNLSVPEVEWVKANSRKAELIAKRKSLT